MESQVICPSISVSFRVLRYSLCCLVFPALLLLASNAAQAQAIQSCEDLCAVIKEPGVSKLNTEGSLCCCLQNSENVLESQAIEKCRQADSTSDAEEAQQVTAE